MAKVLRLILGDQLNRDSSIFDDVARDDVVLMAETWGESLHVRSHKIRSALFLSAMRHFADDIASDLVTKKQLEYWRLDQHEHRDLLELVAERAKAVKATDIVVVQPGERRLLQGLQKLADDAGMSLSVLPDKHFYTDIKDFEDWAEGRKELRLEYFYREQRKRFVVLMDDKEPCGGSWNFDKKNRGSFGKKGPGQLPEPKAFKPDKITKQVIEDISDAPAELAGELKEFVWPVTAKQAEQALDDFIEHRLIAFGEYQDAMWTDEPYLYHSRISAAMNLKLLNPRTVVEAVEKAYRSGDVEIAAAEGFIRQVLGWREYVRGLYWTHYDDFFDNALDASEPLPEFYWTGDTDMECLSQSIRQTLETGYAHHIQRLMVTGLFSLLLGVDPKAIHEWYLGIYVDAVEWVEMPNTLGMSQYSDGGLTASKPYIATGKYIDKMSNYCAHCPYDPAKKHGEDACPFTVLYWDFLQRHFDRFESHPRMALQVRNLNRLSDEELSDNRKAAKALRKSLA